MVGGSGDHSLHATRDSIHRKKQPACSMENEADYETEPTSASFSTKLLGKLPVNLRSLGGLQHYGLCGTAFSRSSAALPIAAATFSSTWSTMGTWASASFHFS